MQFGRYQVEILTEGTMRLDGGSVFGVVPKTTWGTYLQPDARNRVTLGIRQLLVRGPGVVMLVDAGMGTKVPPGLLAGYGVESLSSWEERLSPFGLSPENITHVVLTHLHLDHAGGATKSNPDKSEVIPTFPNARHYVQDLEWKAACLPTDCGKTSYDFANYLPLQDATLLHCVSGDVEILEGIRVKLTGGHTRGHQMVIIGEPNASLYYPGDVVPTAFHLNPTWTAAYDLYPLDVVETRRWLLRQVTNSPHLVLFPHDFSGVFNKVTGTLEHFAVEEHGQSRLEARTELFPTI